MRAVCRPEGRGLLVGARAGGGYFDFGGGWVFSRKIPARIDFIGIGMSGLDGGVLGVGVEYCYSDAVRSVGGW